MSMAFFSLNFQNYILLVHLLEDLKKYENGCEFHITSFKVWIYSIKNIVCF